MVSMSLVATPPKAQLSLCITAIGEVTPGQALRRSGNKVGDQSLGFTPRFS